MEDESKISTQYNMNSLAAPLSLTLTYNGKSVDIYKEDTPFLIGRDADQCALHVNTEFASRVHCLITYKDKVFFIEDNSRNGTHVQITNLPATKLSVNSIHLVGRGKIKLGQAIADDDTDAIQFKLNF